MEQVHSPAGTGKILTLTRFGGIAGIPAIWEVHIDSEPDAQALNQLIQRLPWEKAQSSPPAPAPDRFSYEICCPPHTVVLSELQVEGVWRELINRVVAARTPSVRLHPTKILKERLSKEET